ncbi:MAG: dimethyl sulfoxide reductase anchor subunit [Spirochaetia bacterium]|nr:dimethyl sulfoxide reductase anchor subunit [Spirochaetia bacterium]
MNEMILNIQNLLLEKVNIFRDVSFSNKTESKASFPALHQNSQEYRNRFVIHVDRCIGCHACEVACSEQNGLPPDARWRHVGEIEFGEFPESTRLYYSMSCNHCLDAPCMKGCPANAYEINHRGIVVHLDDECIGCGYCTWNCPYGAPVYQKDRHIVTKCDMCTNRLDRGKNPACMDVCPAEAIEIETVPVSEIQSNYARDCASPGLPSPEISVPSTRIVSRKKVDSEKTAGRDRVYIQPAESHISLVLMTVLSQIAGGGFIFSIVLHGIYSLTGFFENLLNVIQLNTLTSSLIFLLSIGASVFHLGRPVFAYRAVRGWSHSWLSREAIAFMIASGFLIYDLAVNAYSFFVSQYFQYSPNMPFVFIAAEFLFFGIFAGSKIYRVPARPFWNSRATTFEFLLVPFFSGSVLFLTVFFFTQMFYGEPHIKNNGWMFVSFLSISFMGGTLVYAVNSRKIKSSLKEGRTVMKKSVQLYRDLFGKHMRFRNILFLSVYALIISAALSSLNGNFTGSFAASLAGLILAVSFLVLHRYVFFRTGIPLEMPSNYFEPVAKSVKIYDLKKESYQGDDV